MKSTLLEKQNLSEYFNVFYGYGLIIHSGFDIDLMSSYNSTC